MAEVWDENWSGSTKTLDMHVLALRRKLAAAGLPASRSPPCAGTATGTRPLTWATHLLFGVTLGTIGSPITHSAIAGMPPRWSGWPLSPSASRRSCARL